MSFGHGVCDRDIHRYTGISQRAMKRLRKTYRETGEVAKVLVCTGRPRLLDSLDAGVRISTCFSGWSVPVDIAQFLEGCIERQPDIMLVELQDLLHEVCGQEVSISTISRTLGRRGFTYKQVSLSLLPDGTLILP